MYRKCAVLGVIVSLTLATLTAAFADTAVVVGINKYPGLRDGAQSYDLHGCVNDAQTVADALKSRGFDNVIFLADEQATKEIILGKLTELKLKADDRFAFYFAGHGTTSSSGDGCLLTHKSTANSEANDIGAKDLYAAVSALRCRSRSVMMDSCFSGGMMMSSRAVMRGHRQSRGYVRKGFSPAIVKANQSDGAQFLSGRAIAPRAGVDICYMAAARANEQALEDTFGNQVHGLFTKYLVDTLTKGDKLCWGDLHSAIGQQVEESSDQLQHPMLSPGFTDKPLFGGEKMKAPEEPQPSTTDKKWDVYHGQNVDAAKIKIELDPNDTTFFVKKSLFAINATVGNTGGYLVMLERGTSGEIKMIFPKDLVTASAKVTPGQTVSYPGQEKKFACDAPGHEFIKAILFANESGVNALLDVFRKVNGPQLDGRALSRSKDIFVVDTHTNVSSVGFYTSDVTFEVVKP